MKINKTGSLASRWGKTYKSLAGAMLLAVSAQGLLTSCDDFLTIKPQNEIVLENFWTEEADVNSVLYSCYAKLASTDCMKRMIVWGESRSDNMVTGSGAPNDLMQIFKENILETNSYTNWQCFYETINRCNTVLHYAPGVNAIDPNFTDAELRATIAEATTLRTLCYFYLIRTFRDVPYVTEPSIEDMQNYQIPATPFDEVLDHLIADMEAVKDDAVRSYGEDSDENKYRVTRWACYALLADLYLWKGDWQACIDYCDLVINQKIAEHEKGYSENPTTWPVFLYDGYPLISETGASGNYAGTAYGRIFGEGASFESIFELHCDQRESGENIAVADFYGTSSQRNGQIGAASFIYDGVFDGANKYFAKTDNRYLEYMFSSNNKAYISKYVYRTISFNTTTTTGAAPRVDASVRSSSDANWIIYRLTDVMLMRAEAEIEMAGEVEAGSTPSDEQVQHYRNAFATILAVWKRANNKRTSTSELLKFDDYGNSRTDMEDLLLEERQRELLFEGKRWFDLLRFSRRYKDNTRLLQKVTPKFQENASVIRVKLATQDALYWPYNKEELKQNPHLVQNPAYETDNTEKNF